MDCKFCNRENTKHSCILRGNRVCDVCVVLVDESQEGYDEQNHQAGKCPNGACEQMKVKEKDMVTREKVRYSEAF